MLPPGHPSQPLLTPLPQPGSSGWLSLCASIAAQPVCSEAVCSPLCLPRRTSILPLFLRLLGELPLGAGLS